MFDRSRITGGIVVYQLLALDLDGTLMGADLTIAQPVRAAIAAAQARGVAITIATGRPFGATLPFAKQLDIRDPLICYQGALVRHPITGETFYHVGLPGTLAAEAVRLLLEANLFTIAFIDEQLCIAERRPELDIYLSYHPEANEVVVVPNLAARLADTTPTKLLFCATPPVVERELTWLADHFAGRASVLRSHALFGELTPLGVSKGSALEALAAQLGIAREHVMAIGDHENDLAMVQWAGCGLAMGNAIPAVQAAAVAVLPSVEEHGVAWAIEHYLLNPDGQ